jgi:hypothetical protein
MRVLIPVLFVVSLCVGCAFMERARIAAVTPDPQTGITPAAQITGNLPGVVANPLNIPGWLQIIGGVAGIVLTAAGAYGVKQRAALTTTNKVLVELAKATTPPEPAKP